MQQISARAIWALLAAQVMVMLSHLFHLPWLIIVLCVVAFALRLGFQYGLFAKPNAWLKFLLMLTATAAIIMEYKNPIGLEPSTALLIAAFALKSLELDSRRDFYLLVYVCFFAIATRLIFDQDLILTLYLLGSASLALLALFLLNADLAAVANKQKINKPESFARVSRQLSASVLQAIPLMLLMFFFFPRLAPFWSMPLPAASAVTGMSDLMSPGDISNLAQSNELVFTARFKGSVPEQHNLYWRGLVLYDFDGREWQTGQQQYWPMEAAALASQEQSDYEQIMQASGQRWLFPLVPSGLAFNSGVVASSQYSSAYGSGAKALQIKHIQLNTAGNFSLAKPLTQRQVFSWRLLSKPLQRYLSAWQRQQALALPPGFNPKTRDWVKQLRQKHNNDQALIKAILEYFQQQSFYYTLQPPKLGRHTVDEFVFNTREGFCEHYANAFTVMMRMAGIPARVALGYQGGKLNPHEPFLAVYQYDAHAWVEVWLDGSGWTRVDPTAAVAPSRVRLAAIDQANAATAFGGGHFMGNWGQGMWLSLRQRYEQLNYLWQSQVMGFDARQQENLMAKWLGGIDPWRILAVIMSVLALVLLPGFITLLLGSLRNPHTAVDKAYFKFCHRFKPYQLEYQTGQTPWQFARQAQQLCPQQFDEIQAIIAEYMQLSYATKNADSEARLKAFIKRCRRFKAKKA